MGRADSMPPLLSIQDLEVSFPVAGEWTPVANLWLRISDLYGVNLDTFAESTGRVEI